MSLFDYYVESRKVSQSYDKLIDLIVYDRVKSCLSPALSRYVLSLEANHKDGWIGRQGLLRPWIHIWQIYQRVLVDLVLFLGSRPKQEVNQVMGREKPNLELLCLRA